MNRNTRDILEKSARFDATLSSKPGILHGIYPDDEEYPIFAKKALGPYLWDIDDNKYLDFILGFGSIALGHADSRVTSAVVNAIQNGISPTLNVASQAALAAKIAELVPNADKTAFLKTGSDATSLAVRLARAYTKKKYVIRWGYHGWHDWCAPRGTGILPEVRSYTFDFKYNDVESLNKYFKTKGKQIACVIMMPFENEMPAPGFLENVREICDEHKSVLVFDEIRSGFRISLGGAQSYFGVKSDLACFSKAIANGHAISAVSGKKEIMDYVSDISSSSLYFRSADGFAAALANLNILEKEIELVHSRAKQLCNGINVLAKKNNVPVKTTGIEMMPFIEFEYGCKKKNSYVRRVFCQKMLKKGILLHPHHQWFTCSSMTTSDIDYFQTKADETMWEMKSTNTI